MNIRIEHVALWTRDLETSRRFYETYFGAKAGNKYVNTTRKFESYFLTFESGARLEIMTLPVLGDGGTDKQVGLTHIAFSLGSREQVDALTETLRRDGFTVAGEPRTTGDGYYESVVLDPDGNRLELTI